MGTQNTHSLSNMHPLSHTLAHTLSHTHTHTHSLSVSLFLSLSLTHTHTYFQSVLFHVFQSCSEDLISRSHTETSHQTHHNLDISTPRERNLNPKIQGTIALPVQPFCRIPLGLSGEARLHHNEDTKLSESRSELEVMFALS